MSPIAPHLALGVATVLTGVLTGPGPGAGAVPAFASSSMPSDPFATGVRWTWSATADVPWIPRDVVFAADGELVWTAPAVGNPALAVLAAGEDATAAPLYADHGVAAALGPVLVRAGDGADELFAVAQYPLGAARRTEVARYDAPTTSSAKAAFAPVWTYDVGVASVRPPCVESNDDGSALVVAVHDGSGAVVDWIDPETGTRLSRVFANGLALSALALSDSGDRVALVAGLDLWVVESNGSVLHHETLAASTDALALSADGRTLAVGGFGTVRLLREAGGAFSALQTLTGGPAELPTRAVLDGDGGTLAIGWWNFATGTSVRLEVWDVASGQRRVHRVQIGAPGTRQNFPQAVALTRDGARVAFGLWGSGDAQPEALLVDVASDTDVVALDLDGSVEALSLDASGSRLALCAKDTHANDFASTGSVVLVDSGERDVQVISPPTPGGVLELAARRPGQLLTVFAVGVPGTALPLPGLGTGGLDPSQPIFYFGAAADSTGRAFRTLPLPAAPDLAHAALAVQAVFVAPTWAVLSATVVRPTIL